MSATLRPKLTVARAVGGLARAAGRGGGTSLPGKVLMRLDPQAIRALAARLPGMPAEAAWLTAFRVPTLMDTRRAQEQLGWSPRWDAEATLRETIEGARATGGI